MEKNQKNSPNVFEQDKGKDTNFLPNSKEIKPDFSDINNPATFLNHVEQLKKTVEAERKAKTNPFPVEVFPEAVQEIITATNESLNFPIDFIGASILYAVSVAIGNTHRAEIMKGYDQNAVLYMAIVGRTGTNKSHPLSFALKPIEQRDSLKFQEYQRKKIEYDTIVNLTKKEREQQDEPVKPIWEQCLVTDFTPEAKKLLFDWQKEITDISNANEGVSGIYAKMEMYAVRLALILGMMRFACGEGDKQAVGIEAAQGAIKLVEYFKNVAIKVHSFISNASPVDKLPTDKQNIYNALPDTFTTSEGVRIAERMEMAPRTFKRFLVNRELFNNHTRGEYEKRY